VSVDKRPIAGACFSNVGRSTSCTKVFAVLKRISMLSDGAVGFTAMRVSVNTLRFAIPAQLKALKNRQIFNAKTWIKA
jgi:hypothetical protein